MRTESAHFILRGRAHESRDALGSLIIPEDHAVYLSLDAIDRSPSLTLYKGMARKFREIPSPDEIREHLASNPYYRVKEGSLEVIKITVTQYVEEVAL